MRGEGNCGRVTDRGEEACECEGKCQPECPRWPHSRRTDEATNRNVIEATEQLKMSSPDTAKSSHEALLVDGELVSGKSTFILGEVCGAYP